VVADRVFLTELSVQMTGDVTRDQTAGRAPQSTGDTWSVSGDGATGSLPM